MDNSQQVQLDFKPPIGTIRLSDPERHNVLDTHGWQELATAFRTVSEREDLTCVAVCGTGGRAFSAGSDIAAFEDQRDTPEDVLEYSAGIAAAMNAVRSCRHPTVGIIEGLCVGGGLEIAACCDLRVCGESSRFGAPINRLGLTMSHDEIRPLLELLGPGPVLEILLGGDLMDSDRALTVGLVSRVWPDEEVVERGYRLAARIAAGAPRVNRWHKKFVRQLLEGRPLSAEERDEVHEAFHTADYREGRRAFLEKRDPHFTGE